ncbi:hypothetical protein [Actinomadura parmotrematis]|uniref:PE domain-containing protein n=1 Tax=Actinomadura parmotrematis TaxID=2864039 RepID=A0ABS7FRL0_9ACTN|nr:hypothetical protein [Actinomadura parmotrematis]MBW8482168.1 hypothetical protein [Actinomadura parmotrematis]
MNLFSASPLTSGWTEQEWQAETRALRSALAALGTPVAECLPGEPAACGESTPSHYATYAGMLRARAETLAEVNLGQDSDGMRVADRVYRENLDGYRAKFGLARRR